MATVDTIVKVLEKHYVYYDGFSQDDSWQCNCQRDPKKASGYQAHYRTRAEVEHHIAEQVAAALDTPTTDNVTEQPFWRNGPRER